MYRLARYYLASLVLAASAFSFFGLLPYSPIDILLMSVFLPAASFLFNLAFSKALNIKANPESAFITGLILTLIVGPVSVVANLWLLLFLSGSAMASKYLFAWKKKHIFNPAAFAVLASFFVFSDGASWWVGSAYLAPIAVVFGIAILRKVRRERLALSFLLAYTALFVALNIQSFGSINDILNLLWNLAIFSPILFFVSIMLPEPQTSPTGPVRQIFYGALVGVLFAIIPAYFNATYALELSLIIGNIFTFMTAKDSKIILKFKRKEEKASGIYGFWFEPKKKFDFSPGQFLEWTVYHGRADSRGIRRYFTIASSPTENSILLTTKISEKSSSFKKALMGLKEGDEISATGPMGSFTLPKDNKKIVLIAGGIGVTPFRSMARYLLDKGGQEDAVLMYMANYPQEFAFKDIFSEAEKKAGIKTVYSITDKSNISPDWNGEEGVIDAEMVKNNIEDWQERIFYLSGPEPMARSLKSMLKKMGVKDENIRTDYFPGYENI